MLPEIETILTSPNAVSELNIPEGLSHMGKNNGNPDLVCKKYYTGYLTLIKLLHILVCVLRLNSILKGSSNAYI